MATKVGIFCFKFSLNPLKFSLTRENDKSQKLSDEIDHNTKCQTAIFYNSTSY